MKNPFKRKRTDEEILNTFFGQIMLVFIGTTISIICTLGTDKVIEIQMKRENQRLSAMMVMSNIERFPEPWIDAPISWPATTALPRGC